MLMWGACNERILTLEYLFISLCYVVKLRSSNGTLTLNREAIQYTTVIGSIC